MAVKKITPANLTWDKSGLPRSTTFEDVYFSAENGLEETRHVFLKGNDLEQRWASLDENQTFVICETGFGSGLNLLAAAELWNRTAPKMARLHFISTELYPMTRLDLKRALQYWAELSDLAEALMDNYPALTPGFHRFQLEAQISVTIIFDEVANGLTSLCPALDTETRDCQNWHVDAWFLDGFAPSKNPDMWSEQVFALIDRLSGGDTSIATFSCAGITKRGLQNRGFDIKKIPGFGRKREMLVARHHSGLAVKLKSQQQSCGKASACWHLDRRQAKKPETVAIIGSGIAGCSTAEALARRGIHSSIFDTDSEIAGGASGNPQVALYARLSPEVGNLEDFALQALNYARNYYAQKLTSDELGCITGLVQLPRSEQELVKMKKIADRFSEAPELVSFLDASEISQKTAMKFGTEPVGGGLWFPSSGWVNGKAFNRHLVELSGADFVPETKISSITEQDGQYLLSTDENNIGAFGTVILCAAMGTLFHRPASWLPVRPIRGQISFLANQTETETLKTVLCRETSITPVYKGIQSIGANYELDSESAAVRPQDHLHNINALQKLLGREKPLSINRETLSGRAGTRTSTPDYLPIVGTLPSKDAFEEQFALWRKDRKKPIPKAHDSYSGLYLNLGYGSRGYVYAPLCAEMLAAKIAAEPEPVSVEMQRLLHPARFLVRSLSRNRPIKAKH